MRKVTLGEIMEVRRGTSLAGEYYATSGRYKRLTLGNFNYPCGGFKENTSKKDIYFTGTVKPEFILKKGAIITPLTEQVRGLLGETARIPEDDMYIQSGDVGLVIPDETVLDPAFAYYLVSSPVVKAQLDAASQQTKIRHTSPEAIKRCTAWIPDLETQKAIGKLLDSLNTRISINNTIISELESMAKDIYDYWFVQFDFPDENGKPYKSSGGKMVWCEDLKKEIPAVWKATTMNRYIGRITNGLNPRKNFVLGHGTNRYVTIKSLKGTTIDWASCDLCDDEALKKINARSQLQTGDVIFSAIGTIGRSFYIQERPDNWNISETSFTLRAREDVPPDFFYSLLRSDEIQKKADQKAAGSTMRCLVTDALCGIGVVDIQKEIMNSFSTRIHPIYQLLYQKHKENNELASLRDWLLPMLMNGQVKVG